MAYQKKDFCIIGMGRFGETIANLLISQGNSVIAIDSDRDKINKISDKVSFASTLDATNPDALISIGIKDVHHVIVAIGENIKDSIMTCAALIEIGFLKDGETRITAKASNERHASVLKKLGIKDIVRPEKEIGSNTAARIMGAGKEYSSEIIKAIYLSGESVLYKIKVTNKEIDGKLIEDIGPKIKNLLFVSITKRKGQNSFQNAVIPGGKTIVNVGDLVWLTTSQTNIDSVLRSLCEK